MIYFAGCPNKLGLKPCWSLSNEMKVSWRTAVPMISRSKQDAHVTAHHKTEPQKNRCHSEHHHIHNSIISWRSIQLLILLKKKDQIHIFQNNLPLPCLSQMVGIFLLKWLSYKRTYWDQLTVGQHVCQQKGDKHWRSIPPNITDHHQLNIAHQFTFCIKVV